MYCRNCGVLVNNSDMICAKCLVPLGAGEQFCQACGAAAQKGRPSCPSCGAKLSLSLRQTGQTGFKSKRVSVLLALILGFFGAHDFYLGNKKWGLFKLITSSISLALYFTVAIVLFVINLFWGILDGLLILSDRRDKDAFGYPMRK